MHFSYFILGHKDVVDLLIKKRADFNLKMGDLSAKEIARDFGHTKILQLFES